MLSDPSSGVDAPAAILLETVQGEGGLNVASPQWLRRVAALAATAGALLIVDDIQAGCGRTGTFFSFEQAGVEPDLVVLSKSISGYGLPMALLLIRPELDVWRRASTTAPSAATTTPSSPHAWLSRSSGRPPQLHVDVASARSSPTAAGIAGPVPGTRVKGRGMMQGLDVGSGELAVGIIRRCFEQGLVMETSGAYDEVVKSLPPSPPPTNCCWGPDGRRPRGEVVHRQRGRGTASATAVDPGRCIGGGFGISDVLAPPVATPRRGSRAAGGHYDNGRGAAGRASGSPVRAAVRPAPRTGDADQLAVDDGSS